MSTHTHVVTVSPATVPDPPSLTGYAKITDVQAAVDKIEGTNTDPAITIASLAARLAKLEGTSPPVPPSAPTGLGATAGSGQVQLAWSAVMAITGYRVYRNSVLVGSPTSPSFSDTGLTNGVTYSYQVSAVNSVGEGPKSTTITATPSSSPPPPPPPDTSGLYGPAVGYDTKSNIPIRNNQKEAVIFVAGSSSPITGVRFVARGGTNYSAGNGGTMRITVQTVSNGQPTGTVLATVDWATGYPGGTWETYPLVNFSSPASVTSGTHYAIVHENTVGGQSNYISVNHILNYSRSSPRQPRWADEDLALLITDTGSWGGQRGETPVMDIVHADGSHDGQCYYEAMILTAPAIAPAIGGSNRACEYFTPSADVTFTEIHLRMRRTSGTGALTVALGGQTATIASSSIPVVAPGNDNGGSVWVTATVASTTLHSGVAQKLELSAPSGTEYTTIPCREGSAKGMASFAFRDGKAQRSSNGGSSWSDVYGSEADLQFYLA